MRKIRKMCERARVVPVSILKLRETTTFGAKKSTPHAIGSGAAVRLPRRAGRDATGELGAAGSAWVVRVAG